MRCVDQEEKFKISNSLRLIKTCRKDEKIWRACV